MALLDRLRKRPRWEDPDPTVRADAVRHLPAEEQDIFERIARGDADAAVRRAAVRRIAAASVLAEIGAADGDAGVREKAAEALVEHALGEDPAAEAALGALREPRHLFQVASSARGEGVRRGAVERLSDTRLLVRLARAAEDAVVRSAALGRLQDAHMVAEVALRSEHKDVALAAVERLAADDPALEEVARRGRHKAAARRARARREEAGLTTAPPLPESAESPHAESPEEVAPATLEPMAEVDEPAALAAAAEPEVESVVEPAAEEPAPADEPEPSPTSAASALRPPTSWGAEAVAATTTSPAPAPESAAEARRRQDLVSRAEELCKRLEALTASASPSLRDADATLRDARTMQGESAHLPGRLARHLKDARAALFAKTQELREAEEWRRWGNATAQEELCKRIEALIPREDLEAVARDLKVLDQRWGEVKTAPKEEAEALRHRYQAARAQLRPRLDAFFARRAAGMAENRHKKEELATRAEALSSSTDWIKAAEELKALQAQWKLVGPVTRKEGEVLWKRFRGACDTFFTRRKEDLKRRKGEWASHLARKLALCERAEALATSTDWEAAAAEVRKLQAEWKEIGPVRRDKSEEVWNRFRTACDAFFERYKHRDQLAKEERRAGREALCLELEALLAPEVEAPEDLAQRIQAAQAKARQAPLGGPEEDALGKRMAAARDRLIERWPERFRGTDLDPEASRARREKLVARVEALASDAPAPTASLSGDELARRLKEALAARTIGGAGEAEARSRNAAEEVRSAQTAWSRLGPVPGEVGAVLEERFRTACQRVLGGSGPRRRSSADAP